MRVTTRTWFAALIGAAVACGGGSDGAAPAPSPAGGQGFVITISGMRFSPLDLHVPPGATVTVVNQDGEVHSVTSQAAPSTFVAGAVNGVSFDTGLFTGTRTFSIPASAPDGTVVPFFCRSHLGAMVTPNGTVTVDAAAAPPASAPDTGASDGGAGGGMPGY
jgi:plastocyanin